MKPETLRSLHRSGQLRTIRRRTRLNKAVLYLLALTLALWCYLMSRDSLGSSPRTQSPASRQVSGGGGPLPLPEERDYR